MTDEEIKRLARAYASEFVKKYRKKEMSDVSAKHIIDVIANDAEEILTWVARDHCIVSKEHVKKLYKDAEEDKFDYGDPTSSIPNDEIMYQRAVGRKQALFRLFGKEMFKDVK